MKLVLSQHTDTINFAFGFYLTGDAKNINVLDNEYFEVIAYHMTKNQTLE